MSTLSHNLDTNSLDKFGKTHLFLALRIVKTKNEDGKEPVIKAKTETRTVYGPIKQLESKLRAWNEDGYQIYFTVNETNGKKRKEDDIIRVRAFCVDIDRDGEQRLVELQKYPLEPSLIIQTSPGKYQAFWIVDDCPLDRFAYYQDALKDAFGGDPISDLPRVMRVPGFNHLKDPDNPFLIKVIQQNDCRYKTADFDKLLSRGDDFIPEESSENTAADRQIDDWVRQVSEAPEGNRNNTLNQKGAWCFAYVKAGEADYDDVYKKLYNAAFACGLDKDEKGIAGIERTLKSAYKKADPRELGLNIVEAEDFDSIDDVPDPQPANKPKTFNVDYPPGLAGDIARYIFKSSRKPVKSFAIAGALSAIAHFNNNFYYVGKSDTALNLYQCLVADTGKGKEDPRNAIKRLAKIGYGEVDSIRETMSSGAAVIRHLYSQANPPEEKKDKHKIIKETKRPENPRLLLLMDEFGIYLQGALSERGSVHQKEFIRELMELFGQGRSYYAGKSYADSAHSIGCIDNPYVNLLATTTPLELFDGVTSKSIDNGFLNRILVIPMDEENKKNLSLDIEIDETLKNRIEKLIDTADPDRFPEKDEEYNSGSLEYEDWGEAKSFLRNIDNPENFKGEYSNLWSRADEQTIRVAGLLAIGDGGIIKMQHLEWAWCYVKQSIEAFSYSLGRDMAEDSFSKQISRALHFITNAFDYTGDRQFRQYCEKGVMPRGKLIKLLKRPARDVDAVIDYLISTKQIIQGKIDKTICFRLLVISDDLS